MRKSKIIFIVLVFLSITSAVYAHPPSDIKINFDPSTKIVTAVILHNTSNPASHYIKKVDIGLNDEEIIELSFIKQDNRESRTVTYFIPNVKDEDVISVEGYCSISGKLKKEITVGLK